MYVAVEGRVLYVFQLPTVLSALVPSLMSSCSASSLLRSLSVDNFPNHVPSRPDKVGKERLLVEARMSVVVSWQTCLGKV